MLADLSYILNAGEYVAIMGESGVGKSTLLNLIAGLDAPDSGEILIDGIAMSSLDDDAATRLRRKEFGFIFQAFHILPHLTLSQNVALPLLLNGIQAEEATERTGQMLFAVGLSGRGDHFSRQLSGGELSESQSPALVLRRSDLADEPPAPRSGTDTTLTLCA